MQRCLALQRFDPGVPKDAAVFTLAVISIGIVTSARFLASLSVTLIFNVYLPMARFSGSVSFLTR